MHGASKSKKTKDVTLRVFEDDSETLGVVARFHKRSKKQQFSVLVNEEQKKVKVLSGGKKK